MQVKNNWVLKALVESLFIAGSILMALAVDEWSENRDFAELADQSLGIFEREILQNRARIADVDPYHKGIQDLLGARRRMRADVRQRGRRLEDAQQLDHGQGRVGDPDQGT